MRASRESRYKVSSSDTRRSVLEAKTRETKSRDRATVANANTGKTKRYIDLLL